MNSTCPYQRRVYKFSESVRNIVCQGYIYTIHNVFTNNCSFRIQIQCRSYRVHLHYVRFSALDSRWNFYQFGASWIVDSMGISHNPFFSCLDELKDFDLPKVFFFFINSKSVTCCSFRLLLRFLWRKLLFSSETLSTCSMRSSLLSVKLICDVFLIEQLPT